MRGFNQEGFHSLCDIKKPVSMKKIPTPTPPPGPKDKVINRCGNLPESQAPAIAGFKAIWMPCA